MPEDAMMSASDRDRNSMFGASLPFRDHRDRATNRAFRPQVLPIVAAGEGMYRIDTPLSPVNVAGPVSWFYWFDMTSC